jgi:hypothetical protein
VLLQLATGFAGRVATMKRLRSLADVRAGSRSKTSEGIGNWACDWLTFLQSWHVDAGRLAQQSLNSRKPPWTVQRPIVGEAAFTPPPPPQQPQQQVAAFDMKDLMPSLMEAMGECLPKFTFHAVRLILLRRGAVWRSLPNNCACEQRKTGLVHLATGPLPGLSDMASTTLLCWNCQWK